MHLIVPMAGKSSRFPNVKPKWMLTHPSGKHMVLEAISGLNLSEFEGIVFTYLDEHEQQHKFLKGFREDLEDMGLMKISSLVNLDKPTQDQPETVLQSIIRAKVKGPIFIKDADNRFSVSIREGNMICFSDLNHSGLIKPKNKSYIMFNDQMEAVNIIEKQVISPFFCVGGYGFESAELFCSTLDKMSIKKDRYISNIIFEMILKKAIFTANGVENYMDWGTLEDWDRFKRSYATLFVDLDGTLVQNSSAHFPPYIGESIPLANNVSIIKELQDSGKFQIIITTSRPLKYENVTRLELDKLGIRPSSLLMGLYHAKRIVINDYSHSNPYKSCDAINLQRNSDNLKDILRDSLGIDYEDI